MKHTKQIAVIGLSGQSIMLKVKAFAKPGETVIAESLSYEPGGKGYNQAIALATLGTEVRFCSSVGYDEYGKYCYKKLLEKKVKPFFIYKKGINTALATVITNKKGENQVNVYHGATSLLNEKDIESFTNEIKASSYLLIQLEQSLETTKKILQIANKYEVPVILDPAPAINYDLDILRSAYIITPNANEANKIFSYQKEDNENELLKKIDKVGLKRVIITLGKEGSLIVWNNKITHIPSITIDVVDTTGAGDAFNAGLSYALNQTQNIYDAVKFATIVAGLTVSKTNVFNSFPTLEEVNSFISKYIKND